MYASNHLRYIYDLVLRKKKYALGALSMMLIATLSRVVEPYLYKILVDTLEQGIKTGEFLDSHIEVIVITITIWAILALITNITRAQQNYLVWYLGNRLSQITHLEGYRRLLNLDYQKHKSKHSSRICKIVDDADTSTWEMLNWWMNSIIPAVIGFVAMLAIAFVVSWEMTLVALIVVPIDVFFIATTLKKTEIQQYRVNKLWQKKHEHMSDQVTNIATYKLNPNEKLFLERQKVYSDQATEKQLKLNRSWRKLEMLKFAVWARFLVMGIGILLLKNNTITLGTLFMFMGIINEIFIPIHVMSEILPQYSRRARYIERYLALMNEKDTVVAPQKAHKFKDFSGSIEFHKVSFAYLNDDTSSNITDPDEEDLEEILAQTSLTTGQKKKADKEKAKEPALILKDVSFDIKPGEHVAIVGHSGAGKTTITGLITRLMDVTNGRILIDNHDIRDYNQEELKAHIGSVLQENALYNETIADNIAYGKPGATREEVIKSSKLACAHEFIKELPEGYDTLIGERGVRLSGGEKQRVAIARAILKSPQIVILDEPTSALDSITEAKVQKGLDELIAGRTAVIIAHRLATVRNADKIIVLEKGEVIGIGTHRDLLKSNETYKEMVHLQTGGFLAE